jgi:ribonuclease HII
MRCTDEFEEALRREGFTLIAGLDEAGRGSLFGPVYAAAVILDVRRRVRGLQDSKVLTPARRAELAAAIQVTAVAWAIGVADAAEIDRINIYQASRLAMRRAVLALQPAPDYLLIDALTIDWACPQRGIVKGDAQVRSIAAASTSGTASARVTGWRVTRDTRRRSTARRSSRSDPRPSTAALTLR